MEELEKIAEFREWLKVEAEKKKEKNTEKSDFNISQLENDANAGDAKAAWKLAQLYKNDNQEKSSYWQDVARGILNERAEKGDGIAMFHIGASHYYKRHHKYGFNKNTDMKKAAEIMRAAEPLLEKQLVEIDEETRYMLSQHYTYGKEGIDSQPEKAITLWKERAENGDIAAQWELGCIYLNGFDDKGATAYEWFIKAANNGNAQAMCLLAESYRHGDIKGGIRCSYKKAIYWHKKALESSENLCLYGEILTDLAWCYLYTSGKLKDAFKAFEMLKELAEIKYDYYNDAWTRTILAECYYSGRGTAKDLAKAFYWWNEGAKGDIPMAQNNIGWCYERGYGVEKDLGKAIEFYTESAKAGNKDAIKNLERVNRKKQGAKVNG